MAKSAEFKFVSEEARVQVERQLSLLKPFPVKRRPRVAKVSPLLKAGQARLEAAAERPNGKLFTVLVGYESEGGEKLACESEPMSRRSADNLCHSLVGRAGLSLCKWAWVFEAKSVPPEPPVGYRLVKLPSQGPAPELVGAVLAEEEAREARKEAMIASGEIPGYCSICGRGEHAGTCESAMAEAA